MASLVNTTKYLIPILILYILQRTSKNRPAKKKKRREHFLSHYKAIITLTPKTDKDITRKEPAPLRNRDAKSSIKYKQTEPINM